MQTRRNTIRVGCLVLALILALSDSADARTRRFRGTRSVPLPLQHLLVARSLVHEAVIAPIRVAYQSSGFTHERVYRGELAEAVEPANVAYYTSRIRRPQPPRSEAGYPDDDEESGNPRQADLSGDEEMSGGAHPVISGSHAVLRNGVAYAPANAPQSVKNAIWAANTIRRKPYVCGGAHGSFSDRGYDCSGAISFALHHAGALAVPIPSSDFMRFGQGGRGRWFTIYARPGHTFAVIAGLRLDTTDFDSGGNVGPRWHVDGRDTFGYVARHPAGL